MGKVKFNPDSEIPSLAGKIILVTGGNEGLGKETVLQLAKHQPAKVFLAARTQEKAKAAIAQLQEKGGPHLAAIEFLQLDLASFDSIKAAAADLEKRTDRLDILVSNAGVYGHGGITKDGYEGTFGVNHMGSALLIRLLLPLLQKTAKPSDVPNGSTRVVILASEAEKFAPEAYAFDEMKSELKSWGIMKKYGQSKLANGHYAMQLERNYPQAKHGVKFVAVHPGAVKSSLGNNVMASLPKPMLKGLRVVIDTVMGLVPTSEGAWNQLWAATATSDSSKLGEPRSGVLYWPVALENKATPKSYDEKMASGLWEWTEKELSPHLPAEES